MTAPTETVTITVAEWRHTCERAAAAERYRELALLIAAVCVLLVFIVASLCVVVWVGNMNAQELLPMALSAAVPLYIMELQERGGPTDTDMERAQRYSDDLGHRGDILLYRGGKKGETAELFNGLAFAIAVLAFCPGGVKAFGQHWEACPQD